MSNNADLTNPPKGVALRPWEAIGMSRATWYRRGKPTTKQEPKQTQKDLAEAFGVSVRTIQRDRAIAGKKTIEEIRKAKAEGRELDVEAVQTIYLSQYAAKLQERETAVWDAATAGLERMQRIQVLKRAVVRA